MSSSPQIIEPQAVKTPRRYDKRKNNGGHVNSGPKPGWLKNLSRNKACKIAQEIDAIASPEQIYKRAIEMNNLELAWRIREDVHNRWSGKPYVAVNPDERAKPSTVINDNRLQMAVQQLLPSGTAPKLPRRRVKRLTGASVETRAVSDLPEDVLSDSSNAK